MWGYAYLRSVARKEKKKKISLAHALSPGERRVRVWKSCARAVRVSHSIYTHQKRPKNIKREITRGKKKTYCDAWLLHSHGSESLSRLRANSLSHSLTFAHALSLVLSYSHAFSCSFGICMFIETYMYISDMYTYIHTQAN